MKNFLILSSFSAKALITLKKQQLFNAPCLISFGIIFLGKTVKLLLYNSLNLIHFIFLKRFEFILLIILLFSSFIFLIKDDSFGGKFLSKNFSPLLFKSSKIF